MNIALFVSNSERLKRYCDLKKIEHHFLNHTIAFFNDMTSSGDIAKAVGILNGNKIEAVVIVGHSLNYYRRKTDAFFFIDKFLENGLNPNKIQLCGIFDEVCLNSNYSKKQLNEKVIVHIESSISRLLYSDNIECNKVNPVKRAVVLGYSEKILLIAQKLVKFNYKIDLIIPASRERCFKRAGENEFFIINFLKNSGLVNFYFNSRVLDLYGYAGDYSLVITSGGEEININCGAIAVCNTSLEFIDTIKPFVHLDIEEKGLFAGLNNSHLKHRTVDAGIFLFNSHSNDTDSVAIEIISLLGRKELTHRIEISKVDENVCGGCGTCVKTCMFRASSVDRMKKSSEIDLKRCKGCGNCVTSCPTGARDLIIEPTRYIFEAVKKLSGFNPNSLKVLFLGCEGSGIRALEKITTEGNYYPLSLMPLTVRCGGRIDTQFILYALTSGFNGIFIAMCAEERCQNIVGNLDLERRITVFKDLIKNLGLNPMRIKLFESDPQDEKGCLKGILSFYEELICIDKGVRYA